MTTIDVHAHAVPDGALRERERHPAAFPDIQLPSLPASGTGPRRVRLKFPGEPWTRPVMSGLLDWAAREHWMREQGIDQPWISGWLDLFGPGWPAAQAVAWCRLLNETLAEAIAGQPAYVGSATLPLVNPAQAAEELAYAIEQLGFRVATIPTGPAAVAGRPTEIADPALEPFWEAAAHYRVPVIVHPGDAGDDPRLAANDLANIVGRGAETTLAVTRLLFAGTWDRYPDLPIVLVQGGGFLPYRLGRIDHGYELAHPGQTGQGDQLLRRLYYDALVFRPGALWLLLEVAGPERVMLDSDYPLALGDLALLQLLRTAGLEPPVIDNIRGRVAQVLLHQVVTG